MYLFLGAFEHGQVRVQGSICHCLAFCLKDPNLEELKNENMISSKRSHSMIFLTNVACITFEVRFSKKRLCFLFITQ